MRGLACEEPGCRLAHPGYDWQQVLAFLHRQVLCAGRTGIGARFEPGALEHLPELARLDVLSWRVMPMTMAPSV
jgi:hypothetical protein